jgi:hypothetical protein
MSQFKEAQVMMNLTRARMLLDSSKDMDLEVHKVMESLFQTIYFLVSEVKEMSAISDLTGGLGGGQVKIFETEDEMKQFLAKQGGGIGKQEQSAESKAAYEAQKAKQYL